MTVSIVASLAVMATGGAMGQPQMMPEGIAWGNGPTVVLNHVADINGIEWLPAWKTTTENVELYFDVMKAFDLWAVELDTAFDAVGVDYGLLFMGNEWWMGGDPGNPPPAGGIPIVEVPCPLGVRPPCFGPPPTPGAPLVAEGPAVQVRRADGLYVFNVEPRAEWRWP